jgi:predicted flavoprotein YhiN
MALVALVLGTRPTVTRAAMLHYLQEFYDIVEGAVSICRTRSDDFIVRFARQEDLDSVLNHQRPTSAPFALHWRQWSRLIMASMGAFRYRVLAHRRWLR